jgi:hypothetical protein
MFIVPKVDSIRNHFIRGSLHPTFQKLSSASCSSAVSNGFLGLGDPDPKILPMLNGNPENLSKKKINREISQDSVKNLID